MRFFFYGSLLDPATRRQVLGPLARGLTLERARLDGWRLSRPRRSPWPFIRPCRGSSVEGEISSPIARAARRRLYAYEGELYRTRRVSVRTTDGRRLGATVFVPSYSERGGLTGR
ncbi:MAG: gamma-glutamylcyclotransferase [Rhodospirillales bacterium]|nr:gamma-glutamylcyclotransferase [Rhodospirillales bacterium]